MEYVKTFAVLILFIFLSFGCIANIIRHRDERKEARRAAKEAKREKKAAKKAEKLAKRERRAMLRERLRKGEPLDDDEYELYKAGLLEEEEK